MNILDDKQIALLIEQETNKAFWRGVGCAVVMSPLALFALFFLGV